MDDQVRLINREPLHADRGGDHEGDEPLLHSVRRLRLGLPQAEPPSQFGRLHHRVGKPSRLARRGRVEDGVRRELGVGHESQPFENPGAREAARRSVRSKDIIVSEGRRVLEILENGSHATSATATPLHAWERFWTPWYAGMRPEVLKIDLGLPPAPSPGP